MRHVSSKLVYKCKYDTRRFTMKMRNKAWHSLAEKLSILRNEDWTLTHIITLAKWRRCTRTVCRRQHSIRKEGYTFNVAHKDTPVEPRDSRRHQQRNPSSVTQIRPRFQMASVFTPLARTRPPKFGALHTEPASNKTKPRKDKTEKHNCARSA